jgi:hypothetical protein
MPSNPEHPLFKGRSDVRSKLARSENRGDVKSTQCPKQERVGAKFAERWHVPELHRCERPASGHRVHQHGAVQWEKSNAPDATD